MAMNKKEQAEMERLRDELAKAKALRWPTYTKPAPIVVGYVGYKKLVTGWNAHTWNAEYSVREGCTDGMHHNTHGTDKTTTQGPGRFYQTRLEALRVARLEMTERFAEALARIDRAIEAEEEKVASESDANRIAALTEAILTTEDEQ